MHVLTLSSAVGTVCTGIGCQLRSGINLWRESHRGESNNLIPPPSTIISTLYLYCFFLSPSPSLQPLFPSSSHPLSLPPHLVCIWLKKACQLALCTHQCTIQICAPNVDLGPGVVVKEVTCFHLSAVPLMKQPAQVVVLLHAQLTRPESTCVVCHNTCIHTHMTAHDITC